MIMPLLPLDNEALDVMLNHFGKVAIIATTIVSILFMARAVLTALDFGTVEDFGELLKDTFLFFILMALFPSMFRLMVEIMGGLAYRLYFDPAHIPEEKGILSVLAEYNSFYQLFANYMPFVVGHLAQSVSAIMIGVLVGIGPIVILLNTLLDFNKGLFLYLTTLLSLCLWPVLWNLLGLLGNEMWASYQGTQIQRVIFWFAIGLIQWISPWICVYLFQSLEPGEVIKDSVVRKMKLPF